MTMTARRSRGPAPRRGSCPRTRASRARGRARRRRVGPLLEIGSYCGKSAVYLGPRPHEVGTVLFTIDHHHGSEENQAGWDHHDTEVVDPRTGRMDTLPFFRRTIEDAGLEDAVVAIVGDSPTVGRFWQTPVGLLFIDGGHAEDVAMADYDGWARSRGARRRARDPRRVRATRRRRPGPVPRLAARGRRRLHPVDHHRQPPHPPPLAAALPPSVPFPVVVTGSGTNGGWVGENRRDVPGGGARRDHGDRAVGRS